MTSLMDYINNLKSDKLKMIEALRSKGQTIEDSATFTDLVPIITNMETGGGGDLSEYYEMTYSETSSVNMERNVIAQYIKEIPWIDTSNATYMGALFYFSRRLKEIPLLDTSNVTIMRNFCYYCEALESLPMLNTSNVTDLYQAFYQCISLIAMPGWDTHNVETFYNTFAYCNELTDVALLDLSKAITVNGIFTNCRKLTNLGGFKDLGKAYDISRATNYANYTLTLNSANLITHDSAMNIINNLYDIASLGCNPQRVRFHTNVLSLLSEEELAIGTNKGWNITT